MLCSSSPTALEPGIPVMAGSSSGSVGSAATDDAVVGVIRWCQLHSSWATTTTAWACLSDYQLPFLLPTFSHRVNSG